MSAQGPPVRNQLLTLLSPDNLAGILPKLTSVVIELRQEICRQDGIISSVYFPQTGMISLVAQLGDGFQGEVGIIGSEGMFGTSLLAGVDTSFSEAFVQLPGTALRMSASDFRKEVETNIPLRAVLLRYNEALQAQVMQTAACNGHHGLEQRLARWLLMASDRADSSELPLTQDFMAMMLGVYRPSITVTAGILQRAGLIKYASGLVTVIDREALEAASCECYSAVKRRFCSLLAPAG